MSILTPLQKSLLKGIAGSPLGTHYVWTGGTALAYRLNHRYSTDLDFFSGDLQAPEIFLAWIRDFQNKHALKSIRYEEKLNRQLFIFSHGTEQLQMEFVYFPFAPLHKPEKDKHFGIRIDAMQEIAVNKVLTAFQRREPKDAYDLYVLCAQEHFNLKRLLKQAEKKFGTPIDYASLMAKLMTSSERIDSLMPLLLKPEKNLSKKMSEFFQDKGNRFLKMVML